jgi:hypothetical protein
MGREPDRNDWLGKTLRRSSAAAADACLDAETLAAWADGALNAQAAAAVETHASSCSRCTAVLAAMERTAPAVPVQHAWTPARLFRWLVPITAAATAVAIWVIVPDRPITSERTATVQDLPATGERADAANPELGGVPVPVPVPEQRTLRQNPAPRTANREPEATASAAKQQDLQDRDESRRERASAESFGVSLGGAAVAKAPSAAPQAPVAPSAAARSASSTDTLIETARSAQGQAFRLAAPIESTAPSNPLVHWRVIRSVSIERSTDGGKTWTGTAPMPGVAPDNRAALSVGAVVAVRAVDADRAVVRISDNREFYTTDGGLSWTPVQENSKAPF